MFIFFAVTFAAILIIISIGQSPISQRTTSSIKPSDGPSNTNKGAITTPIEEKLAQFEIPILMYHYIRTVDDPEKDIIGAKLSVTPAHFDTQMKWLKNEGYITVNPEYLLSPVKLDKKPVIITFDDGYLDAYTEAYPILKNYDFKATFYIITDYVNSPYYMTWDQIKEMKKYGINFGSHTLTHPDLTKINSETLDNQLRWSKNKLDSELNSTITDFCYPSGKYNNDTIAKLKELGYKTAVTTETGMASQESDLFKLPRKRIQDDSNLALLLAQKD
jgi:peptidoglycan/xylan/chitin deacetylase (PgdA/CDA1 family)